MAESASPNDAPAPSGSKETGSKEKETNNDGPSPSAEKGAEGKPTTGETSTMNTQERQKWGNQFQVVLMCVGFAVGLGNIWRFPKLAFENGGSAFLVPYICCSLFFGLPGLYLEFLVGQYVANGAPIGFRKYAPILQGIGLCMIVSSGLVAVYYNTIVAWVVLYIYKTITFAIEGDYKWTHCGNAWNTAKCVSRVDNKKCIEDTDGAMTIFYNGACHLPTFSLKNVTAVNSGTEFFENEILQQNGGFADGDNGMVWPIFFCLIIVWVLTVLSMMFGVKIMGYISYVTATVPYLLIGVLFVRGITLDGAEDGIRYYLFEPRFEFVLSAKTWANALSQCCFSLSIGMGGLLTFASYSDRSHNCFRDAIIVCFADSFMSFFGGLSVFAVLGSLAQQQGRTVKEIVDEGAGGTSLAFITYPEATAQLPAAWLFTLIFFIMLFLLGISSQLGVAGMVSSSLGDAFPKLFCNKGPLIATPVVCFFLWLMAQSMTTKAGRYWFVLLDEFGPNLGLTFGATCEFLGIAHIYGWRNLKADINEMFGPPNNAVGKYIGRQGYYFLFCFCIISPLLGTIVLVMTLINTTVPPSVGPYVFPGSMHAFGWFIALIGPLLIPLTIAYNARRLRMKGEPMGNLLLPEREHPSYNRIMNGIDINNNNTATNVEAAPADSTNQKTTDPSGEAKV